ncbi:hypothetical protein PHY01_09490 [Pseudonocardia hydrocarbonoxydans]|uniref:DUF3592 domain-containing protein n=1 Tax=Pseudonocardia hydrocarbonoxydans TaxID=76726 RepID=A0A4Y3WMW2_9PSEU|nr:hypothetical protein PHY01_09490 [Pseudonocardia hydrocarbonoxydans]
MTLRADVSTAPRALRYGLLTSVLVLLVCAVLALVAGTAFASASAVLASATQRTFGVVTAVDGDSVTLRWTPSGGTERSDPVELAGPPPPVGTRTEVAHSPAGPPLIPGAAVLADADRALGTLVLAAVAAALVPLVGAWQVLSRRRAAAQPPRTLDAGRVRIQAGLSSRSWLETATVPPRWIPLHFDPALPALPSPAAVRLRGDPLTHRYVAAEIDGRTVPPSGPVRSTEPRGRRTDNPARPDASAASRAAAAAPLRRQLLADLPLTAPAPLVAALWALVDGGGLGTWLAGTALLAALALFVAAVRGTDPT